ncbi:hypothetical protein BMD_1063 [Priestia megaterium DSM 319]|uniref:Uncharacterized protein n=1 Tax=Priestia megaterium (strain DSM 319 / IMG 1521) TaxID=592022 RepID=D5DBE2_PRIM3|nr:hypothetical protein BMD_1063 [Priestia megaterium DSM 319]
MENKAKIPAESEILYGNQRPRNKWSISAHLSNLSGFSWDLFSYVSIFFRLNLLWEIGNSN